MLVYNVYEISEGKVKSFWVVKLFAPFLSSILLHDQLISPHVARFEVQSFFSLVQNFLAGWVGFSEIITISAITKLWPWLSMAKVRFRCFL